MTLSRHIYDEMMVINKHSQYQNIIVSFVIGVPFVQIKDVIWPHTLHLITTNILSGLQNAL